MSKSHFIEDVLVDLVDNSNLLLGAISPQDITAVMSFYNLIIDDKPLTQNQANFIIKMLNKYKVVLQARGHDYTALLANPKWKHPFRQLDMAKRVHVERNENGELHVCLKFPFVLKEAFDKTISPLVRDFGNSTWDAERKLRVLKLHDFNLVQIGEFVNQHNFDIDESFLFALSEVEQIWQNQDHVMPHSMLVDNKVLLVNSPKDADEYWEKNVTGNVNTDLLLAKAMGYCYKPEHTSTSIVEKIAESKQSHFWIKEIPEFFKMYKLVGGNVAVVLNKGDGHFDWLRNFVEAADYSGIPRSDLRVCFRMDKNEDKGFNQWVKDNNLGGKVEGGKIFIFQNKPPKWLFSDAINVTIIATNSLYPVPSTITQTWMNTHPFVCSLGPIKAANAKERKIVEL